MVQEDGLEGLKMKERDNEPRTEPALSPRLGGKRKDRLQKKKKVITD